MQQIREHENIRIWRKKLECALNEQIEIELTNFASYENLSCYFKNADRGYNNLAKFFREEADEELKHARMFMDYQLMRGGEVKFSTLYNNTLPQPQADSSQPVLDAYLIALELEKNTYNALCKLHTSAENDPAFQGFLESCMSEQLASHKKLIDNIQCLTSAKINIGEYLHETVDLVKST